MLAKAAVGTICVFAASSIWLYLALSHGNRTKSWAAVPAQVTSNDAERNARGHATGWATTVQYSVGGIQYSAVVDDYLLGKTEVYVDPNDPTKAVGSRGASIRSYGRPMILTIGSALFAIALSLVAFSPKED